MHLQFAIYFYCYNDDSKELLQSQRFRTGRRFLPSSTL